MCMERVSPFLMQQFDNRSMQHIYLSKSLYLYRRLYELSVRQVSAISLLEWLENFVGFSSARDSGCVNSTTDCCSVP